MRTALAVLAVAACAACDIAGPVVDRLPEPPGLPPTEYGVVVGCRQPPSCEADFVLESELSALRPLHASIAALDEDAGIEDVLDPSAIDWSGDRVVLASGEPVVVVLDEAPAPGTLIELRGPVTLRFQNIASLPGLRIAGPSSESVLELDRVTALDLTIGDTDHRFAGRLVAKHTAFERASVSADRVQLDSAVFIDSFIAAASLVSRDGLMERVVLALGEGLFAPSELRDIDFRRCDALSFFGSNLLKVHIPRCRSDAPTRFYESLVLRSVLDGALSADTSKLEAVRVGQKEQTSLSMWASSGMRIAFCDFADDVQLEPGGTQCSSCTAEALEERVCKLPQGEIDRPVNTTARYNFCEKLDLASRCEEPFPERPRPHTNEE